MKIFNLRSENLAGIVSLSGSSLLLLAGTVENLVVTAIFTTAELTLARFGHKTSGYSAGAVLFAVGDLTLAFSNSISPGSALQFSLVGMAGVWSLGALKYPFELAAKKTKSQNLHNIANTLSTLCGTGNLAFRLPGIFSAVSSGNYLVTGAMSAWATADILAGRLQDKLPQWLIGLQQKEMK